MGNISEVPFKGICNCNKNYIKWGKKEMLGWLNASLKCMKTMKQENGAKLAFNILM